MLICDENGFRLRAFISKPVAGAERRCLAFALEPSLALGSRLKIESNENMHKKIKKQLSSQHYNISNQL